MRQSVQELLDQAKALIKEAMDEAAGIVLYLHLEHGREIRPTCREIVEDASVPELLYSLESKVTRRKAETLANTEDSARRRESEQRRRRKADARYGLMNLPPEEAAAVIAEIEDERPEVVVEHHKIQSTKTRRDQAPSPTSKMDATRGKSDYVTLLRLVERLHTPPPADIASDLKDAIAEMLAAWEVRNLTDADYQTLLEG